MPPSAEQAGLRGAPADDGYVDFPLPAFGSVPAASDDYVRDLCTRWFTAEVGLVRRLMRRIARYDRDLQSDAAQVTALFYFQAVANGTRIARLVRDHIEGREPIREPKGVFIRTVTYHRLEALRWMVAKGDSGEKPGSSVGPDLDDWRVASLKVLDRDDHDNDHCLRIRVELVRLADARDRPPDAKEMVETQLRELESLCFEPLRRHGVLDNLTARQRLVFLLRVDPLNTADATALEYTQIQPLAGILGTPMKVPNLRKTLEAAILRLRRLHPDLKDELGDG